MNDKEAIAVLTRMLQEKSLSTEEQEAIRTAIGILSWTKLIDGYTEQRKRARDRKLADSE